MTKCEHSTDALQWASSLAVIVRNSKPSTHGKASISAVSSAMGIPFAIMQALAALAQSGSSLLRRLDPDPPLIEVLALLAPAVSASFPSAFKASPSDTISSDDTKWQIRLLTNCPRPVDGSPIGSPLKGQGRLKIEMLSMPDRPLFLPALPSR
eukprot:GILK01026820.1.p2 GENE.GILK01026820.1~~GILK01026820.1.p2  ORF type:complete len:153 (+),score=6.68 GILK01026820.1:118-576(+)